MQKQRRRSAVISTFVLLRRIISDYPASKITGLQPASVIVRDSLCLTCTETQIVGFLMQSLNQFQVGRELYEKKEVEFQKLLITIDNYLRSVAHVFYNNI